MSNSYENGRLTPNERREQILGVAAVHFSDADFEAVSMQAIAHDAGVTRSLVYHYFPGKEALLDALMRREAHALLVATAPDPTLSAWKNIERGLGAYLAHFLASRGQLSDLYAPRASSPPLVHELADSNRAVHVDRVLSLLGLKNAPLQRIAVQAWLGFVMEAARASAKGPSVSMATLMRLCMDSLFSITDSAIGKDDDDIVVLRKKGNKK